MSPILVALCYGSATLFSLFVLWYFGVKSWWWHTLSIMLAFTLGLVRLPAYFNTPEMTLAVGWVFIALLLWGIAAPLFTVRHGSIHWIGRHR